MIIVSIVLAFVAPFLYFVLTLSVPSNYNYHVGESFANIAIIDIVIISFFKVRKYNILNKTSENKPPKTKRIMWNVIGIVFTMLFVGMILSIIPFFHDSHSQLIGNYSEKIVSKNDYSVIQRDEGSQFWNGGYYVTAPNIIWSKNNTITQITTQDFSHYNYNATENTYWVYPDGNLCTILYTTPDGQNKELIIIDPPTFDKTKWSNQYTIGHLPLGSKVRVNELLTYTTP